VARREQARHGDEFEQALARARDRLIERRMPRFAAIWLWSTVMWSFALYLDGLLGRIGMLAAPLAHGVILLAAIALARSERRTFAAVMGACILLGVTTVALFAAIGGAADFLAFVLLTLYLITAIFFAWGWRPELVLLVCTAAPWGFAIPAMRVHVPPIELTSAIAVGSVIALAIAHGAARGFAVAFRHRESERASRRALEASRNAYRDLAEQAHEPIFAADPAGRLTYANAALARCLGASERTLVGRAMSEFLTGHPDNRALAALFAGPAEEPLPTIELELRTVHGPRWFEAQPALVRDTAGRPSAVQAICRDVTERKHLERERDAVIVREHAARLEAETARHEAEGATRARDEFLAMLSHELRSPLGSILTWTRMLRRGMVEAPRIPTALASLEEAAVAQEHLVGDLLDISRIASGKFSLQLEPVDLPALLAARLEAARATAAANGITLEEQLDRSVGPVRGDPVRLHQVFENLLTNALKFTPSGGRVSVVVGRAGGDAVVTIQDTGIGIPADVLPHVFDEFQQADRSITRRYGGLGLGLAIARRLVDLHGGRIEAASAGEGRGSTFRVWLPSVRRAAAPPESVRAIRRAAPVAPSRLDGVRVVVVEDDPHARDLLATLLAGSGAVVRPAGSVREAVEGVAATPPDVVVTDIAMPGEDGYELVRQLRAMEREGGRRLPVIAVTALASLEDRERALVEGFDEHLTKPIDPGDLLDAVAKRAAR